MGKTNRNRYGGMWQRGFEILGLVVRKLQATLSLQKGVKKGHFVVITTQGWKSERFLIELGYLHNPDFVKLLKQAEEEFGFYQVGALAIPCEPEDLQRIIGSEKQGIGVVTCYC